MNKDNILDNRLIEETNLLRSHYYILNKALNDSAVKLIVNNSIVYLHKSYRGFFKNKFTHNDFKSLIKIMAFKFFNFKYENISDILASINLNDCIFFYNYDDNELDIYTNNDKYFTIDKQSLKDRNLLLHKKPIISIIDENFNYEEQMNLINFFYFINKSLNANVSGILQNVILNVFEECSYEFELYKFHKKIDIFKYSILPTTFDYLMAISIFDYIKNIELYNI